MIRLCHLFLPFSFFFKLQVDNFHEHNRLFELFIELVVYKILWDFALTQTFEIDNLQRIWIII